jgi:hypothetical protein
MQCCIMFVATRLIYKTCFYSLSLNGYQTRSVTLYYETMHIEHGELRLPSVKLSTSRNKRSDSNISELLIHDSLHVCCTLISLCVYQLVPVAGSGSSTLAVLCSTLLYDLFMVGDCSEMKKHFNCPRTLISRVNLILELFFN